MHNVLETIPALFIEQWALVAPLTQSNSNSNMCPEWKLDICQELPVWTKKETVYGLPECLHAQLSPQNSHTLQQSCQEAWVCSLFSSQVLFGIIAQGWTKKQIWSARGISWQPDKAVLTKVHKWSVPSGGIRDKAGKSGEDSSRRILRPRQRHTLSMAYGDCIGFPKAYNGKAYNATKMTLLVI